MNIRNYGPTAMTLHWLMALMILAALPLGMFMTELDLSPTKLKLYSWHKWLGVSIFAVLLFRVAWRATHAPPPLPDSMPAWQRVTAQGLHGLLYLLMFAIPVSGWLMSSAKGFQTVWFGVLPLPDLLEKDKALGEWLAETHEALNGLLIMALVLHVGATLKHHFIDRDEIAGRMMPWLKRS